MNLHRRRFIKGAWIADRLAPADHAGEIASVLVQTRPDRLAGVQAEIERIAGAEVAQRDECGKLVVVLDSAVGQAIGESLTQISLMPHVLSATLVFHAHDTN